MEESLFLQYFGDTPKIRLLDFLINGKMYDYSLSDFARSAGISWNTLKKIFPAFVKNKIVLPTRQIGRAQLYRLNGQNRIVQKLLELDKCLRDVARKSVSIEVEEPISIPA